jgi:hypothetical protein
VTPQELANLSGTAGIIVCLVWAVRYLSERWERTQTDLVATLKTTIENNTIALLRVEETMRGCQRNHENHPATGGTELVRLHGHPRQDPKL